MKPAEMQILIVADEPSLIAALADHAIRSLDANLTIVNTLEEARSYLVTSRFDVILAADRLADGQGDALAAARGCVSQTPVVLIGGHLKSQDLLAALRSGVVDVFTQPFESERLATVIRKAAADHRHRENAERRSKRLRRISSKLVRDRRELRRRVDLICNDLVSAYRRLATKVVTIREGESPSGSRQQIDRVPPAGA